MSKKILFMSSAKLTTISLGLLLVIFCTIGMSFRPVYGEDEAELVMSGPRHAHWVSESSGCTSTSYTYNNKTDYGKAVAKTLGGGSVSVSNGSNSTSSYTNNSSTTVGAQSYVTWNTGYGNSTSTGQTSDADLATKHSNSITLTATPASGYLFVGWYAEEACTTLLSSLETYQPTVVIPGGVYEKGTITTENEAKNKYGNWQSSGNPYTETFYAKFQEITPVNLTFAACEGGTYTVTINSSSSTVSTSDIVKTGITTSVSLSATQAEGYVFTGWYQVDGNGVLSDLSSDASLSKSFSENLTIGARFVSKQTGQFKIGSTTYYGLKAATIAAQANDVIIPVAEETVVDGSDLLSADNGIYTIPSGVKLLIPYSSANDFQTLPKVVTSTGTLSAYRKLILMDGVNIVVSSGAQICVGGQVMAGGGNNPTGYTTGACGVLDMSRGGHLELNSSSTLYCWGFIKGQDMDQGNNTVGVGTMTVNSGATVWETFSVGDWRGGSGTSSMLSTRFFPFQSYFMQNIEVPTTYWHGSSEWCYFTLNATGGPYDTKFAVIGSENCLFKLQDANSKVRKWYDPTTDLTCFELSGTAVLDELKLKITGLPLISTLDIQSSKFDLPITSNMHVILANCTMNLTKPLTVQPGAIIEIKNDATVTLGTSIYLYDKEEWEPCVCGKYFRSTSNLTSHKDRGDGSSKGKLDDAMFIIDGVLTINSDGKLYSTAGGAALVGNGGGRLTYPSSLPTDGSSSLRWYKKDKTSGDGETGTVAVNAANLCNEDASYTKAIASKTFYNKWGRWFVAADKDERSDHTYAFTYISSGAVSGTSGTSTNPAVSAVYAPDKTGLIAGVKWCNVAQDATCSNIFNATQALNETPASDIRYTYPSSSWLQLLRTETEGVYGGSDNSLYAVEGCAVNSLGSVDENCLYTINDVKKALVDGHFVALEKNTEDEAWHDVANPTNYYICFEGCNWHPATKYAGEEKAYIVEEGDYIWYNNDWLLVEREDPFFFDYNEQNVKRYYEYEDGAWVLASPRVRVVDAIETRDFYFINEAFTVANGKKNTTITLLKDIPTITTALTYSAKNTTCTLDLNGHVLPGSISSMLKIDASGSTFTITDNTVEKLGRIQLTVDDNARRYCVNLTAGSLILNAGTISAVNTKAYDKANSITSTQSCGLIVKPGMTFTMDGGRIEALAAHNPYGIYVEGSTTSGGTITINGGTVHSETTQISSPYGIYGYGTWNINSGATIEAVAQTTSACALYVEATTSKYFGTLNLKGGTINATSTTNTATGVFVNGVYIMAKTTPNTISSTYRAVANITGGTINAITNGTTTAYGIQSRGTTTIANATVNVTPKTTTGYAFFVQDGTTTINSGTFNVNATTTAKGIYANGATPDDKTGRPYNPNVIVNGGVFNVTATTSTPSHGIHMDCNIRNITSTASGYYAGVYSSIPTVTVNGGEFYVHSTTKEAWGAYVGRNYRFETGTNTVAEWYRPTLTINDGKFEVTTGSGANAEAIRSYGTTHVNGGDFTATAKTSAAYGFRVMDGIGTTSNNPKFTVKATTTSAFGAVADVSQPADKTGVPCQGDLTIGGGTFDVDAVTSDAYGLYVNASGRVITSTADGYYPGDYSSIGRATVNSGTFNVATTTLNAIGAYVKRDVQANRFVNYGELTINDGDFTVATSVQTKGKNCIGVWTYGTTTINGGTFDVTAANSTTAANGYYAFGVYALDGNTIINNSPEFTVKAYVSAYGVYANADQANATTGLTYNSNVTVNGGTYNVSTTGTTSAIGAIVSVPAVRVIASGDYAGDYYSSAALTINDGTFNVESATTTATGAYAGRNYVSANTMPNTFLKYNYGNLFIHGGTFNVSTNSETGTTTADGVKSHGTTLIDGGTFNVTPKTTTAYGVRVYAGKTTINETTEHSPEFNVTATTTAYGVMAGGGEAPNSSTGLCYDGEVEVNAGTFNVETTSDKPAYGVYVYVGTRKITSTSSGYYRGNYAYAGIATINGGEFNVTSKKTEAYGIFVPAGATQSGATAYDPANATPECTVNGGKFWITGTSAIYMTNTKALTDNYKIYGGYYGGALNADYGLSKYAVSPKQVITLNDQNANYPKYTYKVGDGATITWKNGSTTLTSTPNLFELEVTPVYYGTEPTKDADAQYTYTFDGWSTTDGGDKLASLPAVTAAATYFAHFTKTEQKYSVKVTSGGHGSVSPASVSNIGCETASGDITATPATGYSFSSWTLPTGITAANGYTANSNPIRIHATAAEKTITANFAAKNYTVTLDDQSATTAGQASITATYDAAMPSIAGNLPEKIGHEFGGYYSATNGGGTQYYNASGTSAHIWDIDAALPTLYAKWTPQTYNITYKDKGNVTFSGVHGSGYPAKHTYGTATALVDPSREGYIFEGWFTSQDCSTGQVATLGATAFTADITLYAKWRQNKVTVTWNATTNGGTAADPATTKVTPGEAVGTLATTSKVGHSYKWYTAPTGGTEVTAATKVSEDKTFYAQFTANTHELAWNFNGGTPSGDYTEANDALAYGSAINYPTLNKTGYTFAGWSTDVTSMPDADLTITASWNPNTNTAYKVEHYWQNINDDEYTKHETVDMTGTTDAATAAVAKSYTGFEAALPFDQGTIAPDGSTVINIYYNRNTYTITWEVDGVTKKNETVRYGATPGYGEDPSKDADAQYTYSFTGWTPEPYAADKDQTYSGSFNTTIRSYTITFVNDNEQFLWDSTFNYGIMPSYKEGKEVPVSSHPNAGGYTYTFAGWEPALTEVNGAATYKATYNRSARSITVSTNDTITVNTIATTTTVKVEGSLAVGDGVTLSTNKLILEASAETSGEIVKTGAIEADSIYFDLILNNPTNRRWNAFTVPFRVDLRKSGKPAIINDEPLTLGRGYDIVYYDGSVRAERGPVAACWKYVEDEEDSTLIPGRAYMIASASRALDTVRFTAADVNTAFDGGEVHVDENPSTTGNVTDGGWNGIGNPTMYHTMMDAGVTECQVHDGGPIGADGYHMYVMTDKKFVVGKAVYVQVDNGKDVDVEQAGNETAVIPAHAPRRTRAEINAERFDVNIAPVDAEVADHIFVLYEENKADEYVILSDLAKAGVSTVRAQMWVDRYGEKLCKNTTALIKNRADYPLGIYAPQSGEYEIFLNGQANENANLYLTYDGKVIWNLNYGGYTASLEAGTNTRYGLRLVRTTAAVVTGIEEATIENGDDIRKVVVEDKVYIIRNGEIYSVTGQKAQ